MAIEAADSGVRARGQLEAEIVRLQEELVSCDRRQHAFEHYLAALGPE